MQLKDIGFYISSYEVVIINDIDSIWLETLLFKDALIKYGYREIISISVDKFLKITIQ